MLSRVRWHVNCKHCFKNRFMAAKANMLKLLQEIRGFAHMANRRPPPRLPALVLTQMRASAGQHSFRPRKLSIAINLPAQPDIPHQVKIVHVKPAPPAVATSPSP